MKKFAATVAILLMMGLLVSCTSSYRYELEQQIEAENVTPLTLDGASEIQNQEAVVTFVMTGRGISVDSIVNVGNFHKGGQADVIYMVRNEASVPMTPVIYFAKYTRIDDYSAVEGKGYKDAPPYVEKWVEVSPTPTEIPPKSAQGYIVSLIMPDGDYDLPKKFAFQVGVGFGDKMQLAASPWWLVTMR